MDAHQHFYLLKLFGGGYAEFYRFRIDARIGQICGVEDVGSSASHSRGEIATDVAQDNHAPASHVFAAVIAQTFDDRHRAGVAHGKSFAATARSKETPRSCAVQRDVAKDHVLVGGRLSLAARL